MVTGSEPVVGTLALHEPGAGRADAAATSTRGATSTRSACCSTSCSPAPRRSSTLRGARRFSRSLRRIREEEPRSPEREAPPVAARSREVAAAARHRRRPPTCPAGSRRARLDHAQGAREGPRRRYETVNALARDLRTAPGGRAGRRGATIGRVSRAEVRAEASRWAGDRRRLPVARDCRRHWRRLAGHPRQSRRAAGARGEQLPARRRAVAGQRREPGHSFDPARPEPHRAHGARSRCRPRSAAGSRASRSSRPPSGRRSGTPTATSASTTRRKSRSNARRRFAAGSSATTIPRLRPARSAWRRSSSSAAATTMPCACCRRLSTGCDGSVEPTIAATMDATANLGRLFWQQGKYADAEPSSKRLSTASGARSGRTTQPR